MSGCGPGAFTCSTFTNTQTCPGWLDESVLKNGLFISIFTCLQAGKVVLCFRQHAEFTFFSQIITLNCKVYPIICLPSIDWTKIVCDFGALLVNLYGEVGNGLPVDSSKTGGRTVLWHDTAIVFGERYFATPWDKLLVESIMSFISSQDGDFQYKFLSTRNFA